MAKKIAKVDMAKLNPNAIVNRMKDRLAKTQLIPITKILPNPHNKNKMGLNYFQALKANIANEDIGFTTPILVRPHAEIPDSYEIIDGEHRWKACRDLGLSSIPAIDCGEMPNALLKYLMLEQNAVRGATKDEDQKKILREIEDDPEWKELFGDFDLWAATITEPPSNEDTSYDVDEDEMDSEEAEDTTLVSLYLNETQLAKYRKIIGQIRLAHGLTAEQAVMYVIEHFEKTTGFGGKTGDKTLDAKQSDLVTDSDDDEIEDDDSGPSYDD